MDPRIERHHAGNGFLEHYRLQKDRECVSVTVSGSQVLLSDTMSETYSDHLCGPPGQFTWGQRLMCQTEISSSQRSPPSSTLKMGRSRPRKRNDCKITRLGGHLISWLPGQHSSHVTLLAGPAFVWETRSQTNLCTITQRRDLDP